MLVLPIALGLSLVLSQWVRQDSWLHYILDIKTVGAVFALPVAWSTSIFAAFLVYHFIPKYKIPWKQSLKAAVIVGPTSEIVRYGFGVYNGYAVSVHKIWGVLAVIPMFILWVQVAWFILLFGAFIIRLPNIQLVEKRLEA